MVCRDKKKKNRRLKDEWVGFTAVILGVIAFGPLIWNTFNYQSTHSLHYGWLILRLITSILWVWYGVANNLPPNVISAAIAIVVFVLLIGAKWYWEENGLAMHQQNALKGTYSE